MKPSTTAERLQEAMNIRGLKQVDVLRLAEPYCRAYGVNLGKTALTQYVSGKIVPRQDKLTILGLALDVSEVWLMGYDGGVDSSHYNSTRYHGINLHAFFTKGTVEFRLFNGTTHAGRIKAYVQFCLAMSAWAINCDHDNLHFKSVAGYTQQQKHDLMLRVLTKRLGMRGPEFKTARLHLTSAFLTEAESENTAA